MATQSTRYHVTVDEYRQMAAAGIFTEVPPVELIEGEIIETVALGGGHLRCVTGLTHVLVHAVGAGLYASTQNSVRLDMPSEPQPGFTILRVLPEGCIPPRTDEVVLVVEVADASLLYDLNMKVPLYARAGIPELWVVDLTAERVLQHGNPGGGRYAMVNELRPGDRITSQMILSRNITVTDIYV